MENLENQANLLRVRFKKVVLKNPKGMGDIARNLNLSTASLKRFTEGLTTKYHFKTLCKIESWIAQQEENETK